MKTRTLFSLFIIAAIFSSCTTTLQQRRVADELYENPPDTYTEEQIDQSGRYRDQAEQSGDTLDRKKDRYGYVPRYGYAPHRWYGHHYWPDWYYWDFYPYYPYYGYGYPWYRSAWFGYHSYWHSPYFGYYPYYPSYYSTYSPRTWQRKTSSGIINSTRKFDANAPHTQRIRRVVSLPENKSSTNTRLSIPSDRTVRMPLRTIKATDGNIRRQNTRSVNRMHYIRPSNIQSTPDRSNIIMRDPVRRHIRTQPIRRSTPVYRSPARSVNRIHQIRPSGSTRIRK